MTGGHWPSLRFHSPLIEPDVRISRIRLSDRLHGKTHDRQSSSCRRSLLGSVWRFVVLLGSSPIASPRLLHKRARSEDPSLHRRYPASTVLRSSPTPVWPAMLAMALGHTRPRQASPDNPRCLASVLCPLPRRTETGALAGFLPRSARPSPLPRRVSIRIATFEACSGFNMLRPTGSLSRPRRPLSQGSGLLSHPNKPLVSYSIKPATIEVESSFTGNTRIRGALGKGAGTSSPHCSGPRTPCPPATPQHTSMLMVGTAHERLRRLAKPCQRLCPPYNS